MATLKVMLERLPSDADRHQAKKPTCTLTAAKAILERAQLFVDAVLGTGFRPPMRGLAIAGRKLLERYPRTPVVAVDLPSGWDADSREFFAPDAYRADAVVTFTAPKLAHVSGMLTRGVLSSRQSSAGTDRGGAHRFAGRGGRVRRPALPGLEAPK